MSIAAKYVDRFLEGMEASGVGMYNKIISQVKYLEPGVSGLFNTEVIAGIAETMQDHINSPAYENRVQALINSVPKISVEVTQYLAKKFRTDPPEEYVQEALVIQEQYNSQLLQAIDDQAVDFAVIGPYINDLFTLVGDSSSLDTAITRTKKVQDAFFSYYVTKVTTILEQYERELISLWSDYFEVKRWRYENPVDKRTRDFCSDHAGGIYTQEEIESWADDDWSGKIPGTTPETIWVNLGGYNCRGTLIPIPNKK